MLKKVIGVLLAAAMLFGTTAPAEEPAGATKDVSSGSDSVEVDFANGDEGFVPIFADYPAEDNSDEFYELDYGWNDIPIDSAGKGLFISGNNHSDDLFMGYYKELDGFTPSKTYIADISFRLATNADGGMIGIGGSPGSSVYVKCGITAQKPAAEKAELNDYRLNIDKGNQGTEGKDMKIAGTIEKHETLFPEKYEYNDYNISAEATAGQDGNIYLIIGTDSGFEGVTSYYIDSIEIKWASKNEPCGQFENDISQAISVGIIENKDYAWNEDITRLQFCNFAFNMLTSVKELPVAKLSRSPFDDVSTPEINTLAFAGIVSGKGEYIFAPDDKITREEAAVILYRIAKYAEAELPKVKPDMSYSDNSEISEWAISPVYSLKILDLITGISDEKFGPKSNYTVEESVSSLVRLYNFIKK